MTLRSKLFSLTTTIFTLCVEAYGQSVLYLECKEEVAILEGSITVTIFTNGKPEITYEKLPPTTIPPEGLQIHKVALNLSSLGGTWRGDASPRFYPTHISFSAKTEGETEIMKIWRKKKKDGTTAFERVTIWHRSDHNPYLRRDSDKQIVASGTCAVVKPPSANLF